MIEPEQRYGRLTVLEPAGRSGKERFWLCRCDCGNETTVKNCNLGRSTKSCGCIRRERASKIGAASVGNTHGQTHGHRPGGPKSRTYNTWQSMKRRCNDPTHHNYKWYGGRGITVCDRWLNSFENFLKDMGPRPEDKTLDRIDVDGNYGPSNCRWADATTQANNKRRRAAA